jgi:hypothetical protein
MFPFPFGFIGSGEVIPDLELISNDYALEFNGTDEYVSAGNPSELQLTGDISVSSWFKTSDSGTQMVIVGRGHVYSSSLSSWCIFRRTNNGIAVQLRSGSAYQYVLSTATTYNDGKWHNVFFTRETSSGNLKLYIDGVLAAPTTTGVTSVLDNETQNTYIGADTQPAEYFNGDIDEVAIWNKVLELEDVQTIYNSTNDNPGKCANLFTGGLGSGLVYWNRMGD